MHAAADFTFICIKVHFITRLIKLRAEARRATAMFGFSFLISGILFSAFTAAAYRFFLRSRERKCHWFAFER